MRTSSFRRFHAGSTSAATPPLPGTRASAQNGSILTSTGVASFDDVIGGGIPLSNLYLIREDRFTGYATLLLKYFLCQGIVSGHALSLTSLDLNPEQLLRDLMGVVESSTASTPEDDSDFIPSASGLFMQSGASSTTRQLGTLRTPADTMKIAWRYQSLSQFSSSPSPTSHMLTSSGKAYCATFDLTKRISESLLEQTMVSLNDAESLAETPDSHFMNNLLQKIQAQIEQGGFKNSDQRNPANKTVLRIAIHSFLSPAWNIHSKKKFQDAFKMLMSLREMLRGTSAVCLITLPAHLYDDYYGRHGQSHPMIQRIHLPFDAVFEIESFAGSPHPVNPRYTSDYHGLFHVWKLFSYNSLTDLTSLSNIQRNSLAFKVRRKRFSIEFFHLPPELASDEEENASNSANTASLKPSTSVSSVTKKRGVIGGTGCSQSHGSKAKLPANSSPLDF